MNNNLLQDPIIEETEDKSQFNDSDVGDENENDQKKGCLILGEFQLILVHCCFSFLAQLGAVLIFCDRFKLYIDGNSDTFTAQYFIGLILSLLQFCAMPIKIINSFL